MHMLCSATVCSGLVTKITTQPWGTQPLRCSPHRNGTAGKGSRNGAREQARGILHVGVAAIRCTHAVREAGTVRLTGRGSSTPASVPLRVSSARWRLGAGMAVLRQVVLTRRLRQAGGEASTLLEAAAATHVRRSSEAPDGKMSGVVQACITLLSAVCKAAAQPTPALGLLAAGNTPGWAEHSDCGPHRRSTWVVLDSVRHSTRMAPSVSALVARCRRLIPARVHQHETAAESQGSPLKVTADAVPAQMAWSLTHGPVRSCSLAVFGTRVLLSNDHTHVR